MAGGVGKLYDRPFAMSFRPVLLALLILVAVIFAGWVATRERPFEATWKGGEVPPNILFLSVDTLRADHLGIYGYVRPTSPNIDAWAEDAVVFDDAQAAASWTLPGLASVMTSFYSSTHKCWTFASRLDPSFTTLAEILRDHGYDTMAVTSHVFLARRYGLQQGFVHFDDEFAHPVMDPPQAITSERVSDKGIRFLRQKAAAKDGTPWMLWLHYFDPHGVYKPHEGISERFGLTEEVDLYDGEIAFTDMHVGRVLDTLRELGLEQDTIVVFFSDHGEEFLDHGALRHGHTLYGELVRVPLIVKAPGTSPRRVRGLVRTVDVMPTVLELVGLAGPPDDMRDTDGTADIEGVSLVPLLRGREIEEELVALAEIKLAEEASFDCVIQGPWKLIVDSTTGDMELYAYRQDPRETNDMADMRPEQVADLAQSLRALIEGARRKGERFEHSEELGLTPVQLENMQGLGYLGDDQP
ncbi:MAG: sulfatase [Planctomycetota bacterium]|nr:sulfatase [Planctomycetota bacterium]